MGRRCFSACNGSGASTLQMRVKPTNLRIFAGGIPAGARVLPGHQLALPGA